MESVPKESVSGIPGIPRDCLTPAIMELREKCPREAALMMVGFVVHTFTNEETWSPEEGRKCEDAFKAWIKWGKGLGIFSTYLKEEQLFEDLLYITLKYSEHLGGLVEWFKSGPVVHNELFERQTKEEFVNVKARPWNPYLV